MSLELFVGPMFAGKSSAIQSIVRRHQALNWPVYVVTHSVDVRYSDTPAVVNHDRHAIPAVSSDCLVPLLETEDYKQSRLVVVEEAQFFPDLVAFVRKAVDRDGKHAVVVGLDGDAERRPFGHILELVPLCDRVTKLTALCKECSDGTPALFTHDTYEGTGVPGPRVGGAERYTALCRKHYLEM